ncbi:hypothetical protein Sps_01354 [Shewanella psychrophila]|uniref:Uncharacterized protein n=1 Tax=Shewanella psychrophila TaxID=225848 RepID=A0A1S6HLW9_9GAMM|nr:hypothetical protein [Shewanella psychrophila]AQS36521.1 hypothetical protein Sps_01354 [Shewanella psychrophila]
MKTSKNLLVFLYASILFPLVGIAVANPVETTEQLENNEAIQSELLMRKNKYLPMSEGQYYDIRTSSGDKFNLFVDSINGNWVESDGEFFNTELMISIRPL